MMRVARTFPVHLVAGTGLAAACLAWFSPVLLAGRVFISDNTMPGFFMPVQLWSDLLYAGFPLLFDPTFANAYPVRILLSLLQEAAGHATSYNAYVASAYAIAAAGAYAYAWELTSDWSAALVCGVSFAFCGFLQAHLGHETIVHTAAWLPWLVWATHRSILAEDRVAAALLSVFAGLCYLASHPQITFQCGLVACLYALAILPRSARPVHALFRYAAAWIAGILLVAWAMVPSWQNGSLSMRGAPSSQLVMEGAVPLDHLLLVVMPWLFGGWLPSAVAPVPAFGDRMFAEIANYVAAPVVLLACIAMMAKGRGLFWMAIGALFLVLSLGPQTPLGQWRARTPPFNLFNNPGRDLLTVHFAFAVLAGLGLARLRAGTVSRGQFAAASIVSLVPVAMACALYPVASRKAAAAGIALGEAWKNPALVVPVGIAAASVAAGWLAWRKRGVSAFLTMAVVLVPALAYFGWFTPWRLASGPAASALDATAAVTGLRAADPKSAGRVAVADGWVGPAGVIPNTSMYFRIPNVAGYGPLLPRDLASFAGLTNAGWIRPASFADTNATMDVLGVRWVFPYASTGTAAPLMVEGVPWHPVALDRYLGHGCDGKPIADEARFVLPTAMQVSRVVLVSTLGCAPRIRDGEQVATISVGSWSVPLLAGSHTAEWSLPCFPAAHRMATRHNAAPVTGKECVGADYVADFTVPGETVRDISVKWSAAGHPNSFMVVKGVTVFDASGAAKPLDPQSALFTNGARWVQHRLPDGGRLLENRRAMPEAWMVDRVVRVPDARLEFASIQEGRLPDGSAFDPSGVAVTSDDRIRGAAGDGRSAIFRVAASRTGASQRTFQVEASVPALLVIGHRYYPGWSAWIDDEEREVLRVNGVLQGVEVPAGRHEVRLAFRPAGFRALLLLAICVAAILLFVTWRGRGSVR